MGRRHSLTWTTMLVRRTAHCYKEVIMLILNSGFRGACGLFHVLWGSTFNDSTTYKVSAMSATSLKTINRWKKLLVISSGKMRQKKYLNTESTAGFESLDSYWTLVATETTAPKYAKLSDNGPRSLEDALRYAELSFPDIKLIYS